MTRSGTSRESAGRRHWVSMCAVVAGVALVAAVQLLEGGSLGALLQAPASLIVLGGTLAATLVSFSPATLRQAMGAARTAFRGNDDDFEELSTRLVALAFRAHRNGLMALEGELGTVRDPFLRNGLTLIIDGASRQLLRDALRAERLAVEAREDIPPRLFETAAGYAPTLGILGAVLGLMRVMQTLADPSALGAGIATAFVATIYGVGLANLILLPIAARLREQAAARSRRRDLMTEALLDVQRRLNPRVVARKTRGFVAQEPRIEDVAKLLAASQPVGVPQ